MHPVLQRQLRRLKLDPHAAPDERGWVALLAAVSTFYSQVDEDRYLLERSLEVSGNELAALAKREREVVLQLAQASKLAGLGTLASGVAHELNNPLASVKGFVEIAAELEENPKIKTMLEKALKQTERMRSIIDHLRRLSREPKDRDFVDLDVAVPIRDSVELLLPRMRNENVECEVLASGVESLVKGDRNRLESVFQNLITNSLDAFAERSTSPQPKKISISLMYSDSQTEIRVSDNAGGIPTDILSRIFDPFFTTKTVGKGTGLGLSISRQVVVDLGGTLEAHSTPGQGTSFLIRLPSSLAGAALPSESIGEISSVKLEALSKAVVKRPRLLILDDEPDVVEFLDFVLQSHFEVLRATCAEDALKILRDQTVDVLLTDVKMPKMSGFDVARLARSVLPKIDVIVMSGHLDSGQDAGESGLSDLLFIEKPFGTPAELSERITTFVSRKTKPQVAA